MLHTPLASITFVLYTNAVGLGAVLAQETEQGESSIVSLRSKFILLPPPPKTRYAVIEKEALAMR